MTALDRRTLMAATVASIATPATLGAKECSTMDWITMSLEARNLAYNNVEHVGPENARKKTEGWAAASQTLREQRPKHLDLAYGNGERNRWDLYPANNPKAPCFVHIHGGYWQRGSKEIFACLSEGPLARGWSAALCAYTLAPEANSDADHQRAEKRVRLAQRQGQRARHPGADHRHRLVRGRASDLIHS